MKHTGEDHSLSYLLSRSSYEPLILATDNEKTILLEDDMTKRIKESKQVIIFNVGGEEFHILLKNFAVLPTTRLSRLVRLRKKKEILKLCDGFVYLGPPHKPEYIFNRNPYYFNAVLDVYRRGELHAPKNACSLTFHADLKFWGIDYYLMDACCILKHYSSLESAKSEAKLAKDAQAQMMKRHKEEDFGKSMVGKTRKFLWNMTEYPDSGRAARIMGSVSLCVVILSTFTFVLQASKESTDELLLIEILKGLDTTFMVFFTAEYFVRLACAPKKWRFFKTVPNLIDFMAILPFFVTLVLEQLEDIKILGRAGKLVRLVRVLRIFRMFKMVKHFERLQSLVITLNEAYKELGLLMLLIMLAMFFCTLLLFFVENDGYVEGEGAKPMTFLDCLWWCILTLTTVGSDDDGPKSESGKFIGSVCAMMAVFIVGMPIPIVVNSFASNYEDHVCKRQIEGLKAEKLAKARDSKLLQGLTYIINFTNAFGGAEKDVQPSVTATPITPRKKENHLIDFASD